MIENSVHVHKFIERLNKTDGLFETVNGLDPNTLEHLKNIRLDELREAGQAEFACKQESNVSNSHTAQKDWFNKDNPLGIAVRDTDHVADDVNLKTLALPGEDSKDKDFEQMMDVVVSPAATYLSLIYQLDNRTSHSSDIPSTVQAFNEPEKSLPEPFSSLSSITSNRTGFGPDATWLASLPTGTASDHNCPVFVSSAVTPSHNQSASVSSRTGAMPAGTCPFPTGQVMDTGTYPFSSGQVMDTGTCPFSSGQVMDTGTYPFSSGQVMDTGTYPFSSGQVMDTGTCPFSSGQVMDTGTYPFSSGQVMDTGTCPFSSGQVMDTGKSQCPLFLKWSSYGHWNMSFLKWSSCGHWNMSFLKWSAFGH
ncbi:hypothetical protein NP493_19g03011 [Ridgeia piscesae]|uniref:Uncharacterized protein n=1 Tax=Ridgeia piscesae TaxID=27915 RepID=A0AAD9UKU4_RIDPI|nr:hypothetical protein NP493_19g03011 [Ridgeia piscesae]